MNTVCHNSTEKGKYTLSPANRKSLTAVYCSFAKHKSNGIPLLRETGCSMISLATNIALIFLNNRLSKFLQPTKIRQWGRLFLNCKMPNSGNWLTVSCILFHQNELFSCSAPPRKRNLLAANVEKSFMQPSPSQEELFISYLCRGQDFGKMRRNSDCNLSNVRAHKQH